MSGNSQGKTLRCRVGAHSWVTRSADGACWQECGRCGRYRKSGVTISRFPPGGSGETGVY